MKELFKLLGVVSINREQAIGDLDAVTRHAQGSATRIGAVGGAVGGMVAAGTLALVQLAANAAGSIQRMTIGASADFEQTGVAFATMLGGGEEGIKRADILLEQLNETAAKTPLQFAELADSTRTLLAFQEPATQVVDTLTRIGDVAAGIRAPIGQIAEIYGKARVQGRLFMEDINQLTGRGIPIITELAKQFGVNESAIRKMVETGQVNFGHLEQAFKDLTSEGGMFFNMMAAQSETLLGKWSTFTDGINVLMRKIGDAIIETFDIKGVLTNATNLLDQWGPRFLDSFQKTLTGLKNTFTVIWNFITRGVDLLRQAFDKNFLGIRDIFDWFSEHVGKRLKLVIEFFQRVSSQADLMSQTIERIFRGLVDIFQGVAYVVKGYLLDPFIKVGQDIGAALTSILSVANTWIDKLAMLLGVDLKAVLGSAGSSIISEFSTVAGDAFARLVTEVENYNNTNDSVIKGLELIRSGSGQLAAAVAAADEASKHAMLNMSKNIDEVAGSTNALITESNAATEALETLGTTASGKASDGVDKTTESVKGLSKELINAIKVFNEYNVLASTQANMGIKAPGRKNEPVWESLSRLGLDQTSELSLDEIIKRLTAKRAVLAKAVADAAINSLGLDQQSPETAEEIKKRLREQAAVNAAMIARAAIASLGLEQTSGETVEEIKMRLKVQAAINSIGIAEAAIASLGLDQNSGETVEEIKLRLTAKRAVRSKDIADAALASLGLDQQSDQTVEEIKAQLAAKRATRTKAIVDAAIASLGLDQAYDGDAKTEIADARDKRQSGMESLLNQAIQLGESVFPGLGAAIQAFQAGPLAGVASIMMTLFGRSEAFQALIYQINKFLEPIIKAFGDLLDALWPTIDVILKLGFVALKPVIELLTKVVAPVLNATAKIIAGIWNVFAKALNWALGWLGVNLPTIDLSSTSGIPREPKGSPTDPLNPDEKQTDVNPFGEDSVGYRGASGSVAEAVVGIPPDVMRGLLQPLVDLETQQVNLLSQLATGTFDIAADKLLQSGQMHLQAQGILANTVDFLVEEMRDLRSTISGNKDFSRTRAYGGV